MTERGLVVLNWGKVVDGAYDYGDEHLCDMKDVEFLGQPTMCYILRRPLFHVVS